MKKLTFTLALILCLVLCVFAFSSCGKKKTADATTAKTTAAPTQPESTEPESTEPEETEPAHVHTPEQEWIVESDPTCVTPGQKVLYCEECGREIDRQEIPVDPGAHKVTDWTVTEAVNMFHTTGSRNGNCVYCHSNIVEELTFEPTIEVFDMSSGKYNYDQINFADIRGENHFYPTEEDPAGNDLYVEFSILWNESILNFNASADPYMCGRFEGSKPLYYFSPVAGCPTSDATVAGAFEWMGNFKTTVSDDEVTTPSSMMSPSSNYADYPNIMGADEANPEYGWHRVGIRYHLELIDGKTGQDLKDYVGTATVYLDGTAIYKLSTGSLGMQVKESQLFTAEVDGEGHVTYSDVDGFVIPFQINRATAKADTVVYVALADVYVSCGKGFVMPVEKVVNPADATLEVAEGVEIAAPVYFQPAN